MKIIRWKFFLPVAILIAAIVVFFVVFFDPIAGRLLSRVASKVNGAKVDVEGFKTKFFAGRVEVAALRVTNRESPMENIVETGAVKFQMIPAEAMRMRFVIPEAGVSGLRFNTARKTSGALPRAAKKEDKAAPGPADKLAEKYKERFQLTFKGLKSEVKERIEFDPKDLTVYKQAEELKTRADELPKDWEARVGNLNAEGRLKEIEAELKSIKETRTDGVEAITAVPAALKKLKETREKLNKLKEDVKTTRESMTTDVKEMRAGIAGLQDAKKADVDGLLSRLNLDFADPERLMEGLLGPAVVERFRTVLKYVQIARQHMPSKKEKESMPKRMRSKGMDVEFPTPAAPPRFWLQNASLDGAYQGVAATGSLSDLTTDPSRAGRPFIANLAGQKGAERFTLKATLDHVGDVSKDSFVLKATGIDLKSVAGEGAAAALSGGTAAADLAFSVVGDGQLGGKIGVSLTGARIDRATFFKLTDVPADASSKEDKIKAQFATNIADAVEAMPEISVTGQLFGTWNDPSIKLSSNLTSAMGNVIKSSVGNIVKEQRAEIEAKVNAVTEQKRAELQAKVDALQNQVNDRLKGVEADVEKKIGDATGINLGGGGEGGSPVKLPKLDKLFKK